MRDRQSQREGKTGEKPGKNHIQNHVQNRGKTREKPGVEITPYNPYRVLPSLKVGRTLSNGERTPSFAFASFAHAVPKIATRVSAAQTINRPEGSAQHGRVNQLVPVAITARPRFAVRILPALISIHSSLALGALRGSCSALNAPCRPCACPLPRTGPLFSASVLPGAAHSAAAARKAQHARALRFAASRLAAGYSRKSEHFSIPSPLEF